MSVMTNTQNIALVDLSAAIEAEMAAELEWECVEAFNPLPDDEDGEVLF